MIKFNLSKTQNPIHECHSHREGDWMVFICSQCNYIRQVNFKTGKMKSTGGDENIIHQGIQSSNFKEEFKPSKNSLN